MVVENNLGSKTTWQFASTQKPTWLLEIKLKGQAKGEVLIVTVSDLVASSILSHKFPVKSN